MKDVNFGLALEITGARGNTPTIAMNARDVLLTYTYFADRGPLYYRLGKRKAATIEWGKDLPLDSGVYSSCALAFPGIAVEVHQSQNLRDLYSKVGPVGGSTVDWMKSEFYDDGVKPSVAINDSQAVVEVHSSEAPLKFGLYYHVGRHDAQKVQFYKKEGTYFGSGLNPRVAMNNRGDVVAVWESKPLGFSIFYRVGRIAGETIEWLGPEPDEGYDSGAEPAVALSDDGFVIEVHRSESLGRQIFHRVGSLNGGAIEWAAPATPFDDGERPNVARVGKLAAQVHLSETTGRVYFSTSLVTDRAAWMSDRLATLGARTLPKLALPASHDAGMYRVTNAVPPPAARTQDLNLYEQLSIGIRYFDLRPRWYDNTFYIHHEVVRDAFGPPLDEVLEDVRRFMEDRRELVILKFSHYRDFTDEVYKKLVQAIQAKLGTWLYTRPDPKQRLADIPLNAYLKDHGTILVVCDELYPVDNPANGIYVFRDWELKYPPSQYDDLRVYDIFTNRASYETVRDDQRRKFEAYNGICKDGKTPCDLFLLSWTVTPPVAEPVRIRAKTANRNLGNEIAGYTIPNRFGRQINFVYLDYVQYARAADVCLYLNGETV